MRFGQPLLNSIDVSNIVVDFLYLFSWCKIGKLNAKKNIIFSTLGSICLSFIQLYNELYSNDWLIENNVVHSSPYQHAWWMFSEPSYYNDKYPKLNNLHEFTMHSRFACHVYRNKINGHLINEQLYQFNQVYRRKRNIGYHSMYHWNLSNWIEPNDTIFNNELINWMLKLCDNWNEFECLWCK